MRHRRRLMRAILSSGRQRRRRHSPYCNWNRSAVQCLWPLATKCRLPRTDVSRLKSLGREKPAL